MEPENTSAAMSEAQPPRPPPPKVKAELPSVQAHLEQLQPLKPEKVRWFYKEDKKWIPFNGSDSLDIERVYRWRHGTQSSGGKMNFEEFCDDSDWEDYHPTVRGSMYEVDVEKRTCVPIYWKDEPARILRATWFQSATLQEHWEPLEEENAERIEETHLSILRSMGVGSYTDISCENPVLHIMEIWPGYCVEWHDISDVRLVSKSAGSKLVQKIGLSGPTPLVRGYHTDCDKTDAPSDITAMVFVIHGIGQILFSTGGILHSCKRLREAADKVVKKYFLAESQRGRVEFFPVEWRTGLKLDEGILKSITPDSVGGVRKLLNESTMDVMYYTSPFFREEIKRTLREQVNIIYEKFCSRNPSFAEKGKVSFIAHSLGSVVLYDVLRAWNAELLKEHAQQADHDVASGNSSLGWPVEFYRTPSESIDECAMVDISEEEEGNDLSRQLQAARKTVIELEAQVKSLRDNSNPLEASKNTENIAFKFKTANAFNIGSPLGVFLVMRGVRPRDDIEQHILPTSVCENMYNIYDPSDPVAYRIEPLIYEHYTSISPIRISSVTKHLPEQTKEGSPKLGVAAASSGWIRGWFSQSKSSDTVVEYQSKGVIMPKTDEEKDQERLRGKVALDHRLDFVLEAGFVEYFSLITSHMSYWSSIDLTKFVLNRIYSQLDSM